MRSEQLPLTERTSSDIEDEVHHGFRWGSKRSFAGISLVVFVAITIVVCGRSPTVEVIVPARVVNLVSVQKGKKDHGEDTSDQEKHQEEDEEDEGQTEEDDDTKKQEGEEEKEEPDFSKCSWGRANCNATKCCNSPGMQCYEQTQWYAQCRQSCKEGPDPTHWDALPWTCKELGERSDGDGKCSAPGEDCSKTQCCQTPGTQCFQKNKDWAVCKSECMEGAPDLEDANSDPWSCKPLGEWTRGASDWVAEQCTPEGEDCTKTQCCAAPGMQCYQQSEYYSQCKPDCQAKNPDAPWDPEWSCKELGGRTPVSAGASAGKLADWATKECKEENTDCRATKCCLGNDMQCYEKNKDWAVCMESCEPGQHPEDNNETWSCKELGPRLSSGLALKGSPSLFCWSLFQTTTYEMDIMKAQMDQGAGIFQCDDYALLSTDDETVLGKTPDGVEAKTIQVEKAEITQSVDGTAGNAKLFINCWRVIVEDGRWKRHAWIIKVDPDAVIIASRVRDHLRPHVMENVYVVNCNAFPDSPNFPMMYGSVEIFSFRAIRTYAEKNGQCMEDMGMMLPQWGEDYFMTHCLDHIGVGRISDFTSVGDNVCTGGNCADAAFSAFHPFKSTDDWQQCWDLAMGKITNPPPPVWT